MKKRILSTLLCVILVLSTVLSGCSKSEDNATAPATGTQTSDKAGNSVAKAVLKLGIWPSADLVDDVKTYEGYSKTMTSLYPNVTVEPASYTYAVDTFVSLAESGNCPTIFETWFTEPQKLIRNKLVADITDVLKEKGWADQMSPSVLSLLSDDKGHIYGVPRDAYALGLMCNVELFEKAGLVDKDGIPIFPKTWDELAQTAVKIKEKTGAAGLCLLAQDAAGGWHFSNIAWCFGAKLVQENADGTYTAHLDSPEAIEAMRYVYDLKWKYDVLTADPLSENWGTGFMQLGTNSAAMYIGANEAVNQPTQVYGLPTDKLAMCGIPAGPRGDRYSLTGGTPYMFSKDATKEEIAAALDFLVVIGKSPEVSETSIMGMEAGAANNVANGVPVIKNFSCWINKELTEAQDKVLAEYGNVDSRLYEQYFKTTQLEGNLKPEEPGDTQRMYEELKDVLQAVLTDKNCDIPALMKQANKNYQTHLDEMAK